MNKLAKRKEENVRKKEYCFPAKRPASFPQDAHFGEINRVSGLGSEKCHRLCCFSDLGVPGVSRKFHPSWHFWAAWNFARLATGCQSRGRGGRRRQHHALLLPRPAFRSALRTGGKSIGVIEIHYQPPSGRKYHSGEAIRANLKYIALFPFCRIKSTQNSSKRPRLLIIRLPHFNMRNMTRQQRCFWICRIQIPVSALRSRTQMQRSSSMRTSP